jgi:glyoxalase-like protein
MAARIDHLLMAVRDLDAAAARLESDYGLASIPGGSHPAMGTANRLVPLGHQYVELLAVEDASNPSAVAARITEWSAGGDALAGVSLAVEDIDAVAARIGSVVVPLERTTSDGVVRFAVTGMEGALGPERLPFFIQWGDGAEYRLGAGPPTHRVAVEGIAWLELSGDPDRARDWLGGDVDGVHLTGGRPGAYRAGIATGEGEIVLSY